MYLHPSGSSPSSIACRARISKVPTASSGLPDAKQSPFAVEEPTLSPVYEPGPALTQTASQSAMARPRASSISLTKGAVREACALGWVLSLYSAMLPSIARAVEHSEVDVSISTILAISLYLYVGGEALE